MNKSHFIDPTTSKIGLLSLLTYLAATTVLPPHSPLFAVLATAIPMLAYEFKVVKLAKRYNWQATKKNWFRLSAILATANIFYTHVPFNEVYHSGFGFIFLIGTGIILVAFPLYSEFLTTNKFNNEKAPESGKHDIKGWIIKIFFLPLMFYGVMHYPTMSTTTWSISAEHDIIDVLTNLILLLFFIDTVFGLIGYICTFKAINSHIQSTNPFILGWISALVCYPPFALMTSGGPLNYGNFTTTWDAFFPNGTTIIIWGGAIVCLTTIYTLSTIAFGIRFSNLTFRGVVRHGPYKYTKHPAYLSKCTSWWLIYCPFAFSANLIDGIIGSILLLTVCIIYYIRAKTEENHLLQYHSYRVYCRWIGRYGLLATIKRKASTFLPKASTQMT